jgi:DNA-binding protein
MDKYRRKEKAKEKTPENEIRVTTATLISNYLRYINTLFTEKKLDTIVIKSTGNAIGKAVSLSEVARRRFKGIHQIAEISTIEIEDEYEPLEEGLDVVKLKRRLTTLNITLTKKEPANKSAPGYLAPLPDGEVQEYKEYRSERTSDKPREYDDREESRGRRRFRGRGRGGRRGRGFRGGYRENRGDEEEYEHEERPASWRPERRPRGRGGRRDGGRRRFRRDYE